MNPPIASPEGKSDGGRQFDSVTVGRVRAFTPVEVQKVSAFTPVSTLTFVLSLPRWGVNLRNSKEFSTGKDLMI